MKGEGKGKKKKKKKKKKKEIRNHAFEPIKKNLI